MKKTKKKLGKPLSRQVRSKAFRAPMSGSGPHRDRKNEYRRQKSIENTLEDTSIK